MEPDGRGVSSISENVVSVALLRFTTGVRFQVPHDAVMRMMDYAGYAISLMAATRGHATLEARGAPRSSSLHEGLVALYAIAHCISHGVGSEGLCGAEMHDA